MISRTLICDCGGRCEYCDDCGHADCHCLCEVEPYGPAVCVDCRHYVQGSGSNPPPSERFCLALDGAVPRDPVTGRNLYHELPRCEDRNCDGHCPDFDRRRGILSRIVAWMFRRRTPVMAPNDRKPRHPCSGT